MITVRKIEPQRVMVWYTPKIESASESYRSEPIFVGNLNEYEFNDLRIEIAKQDLEGFYVEFEGTNYDINKYGAVKNWTKGLFDLATDQLIELFTIATRKKLAETTNL